MCSVTGGYVYRGREYPEMQGIYFFADYCTGRIWGMRPDGQGGWETELLAETGENITSFGEDQSGELFAVSAAGGPSKLFQLVNLGLAENELPVSPIHESDTMTLPRENSRLPYQMQISLVPVPNDVQLPGLHSGAVAHWGGKWIYVGGRTNGVHGGINDENWDGMENFPPRYQNRDIWVIDPETWEATGKSLDDAASGISLRQADALASGNSLFAQEGQYLHYIGGYGYDQTEENFVTYPQLTVLDLDRVIAWVLAEPGTESEPLSAAMQVIEDPYFEITGGHLLQLEEVWHAAVGQSFNGPYNPAAEGTYTREVRRYRLNGTFGAFTVEKLGNFGPQPDWQRRDLNVAPMVWAEGEETVEGFTILSGVFTAGNGAWTTPLLFDGAGLLEDFNPNDPTTLRQGNSIYHCPRLSLFSKGTAESHVLLFGGLSVLTRETPADPWTEDPGVPYVNDIVSIRRDEAGLWTPHWLGEYPEVYDPEDRRARFGTNGELILAADLPLIGHEVLDLDALIGPTEVGHIFGGIVSVAPHSGRTASGITGASNAVFSVTLAPSVNVRYFPDAVADSWGFATSDWFGRFYHLADPWIVHDDLDWLYLWDTGTADLMLYWFEPLGWVFSNESLWPYWYDYDNARWLYYWEEFSPPWVFTDLDTGVTFELTPEGAELSQ